MADTAQAKRDKRKAKIHEIIFEAKTRNGKIFDVVLLCLICMSVAVVMIESVDYLRLKHAKTLHILEWIFTIIFTLEYLLRLYCVRSSWRYAFSFFGIIDLISIIPTYISLFISGAQYFLIIRVMRLLRMFRILKMAEHMYHGDMLVRALRASTPKITVFLFSVVAITCILGTIMYLVEGHNLESGFTSIPKSVYWAIVTLTTVGYGNIAPVTPLGQLIAAVAMVLGYGIIAVPTGIVGFDIYKEYEKSNFNPNSCEGCGKEGHRLNAKYCYSCGYKL